MSRMMALDVGDKRVGVAVSDPLGVTAQGIETWTRVSFQADAEHLGRLARQYDVDRIIVGLPRNMNGTLGAQSEKVRRYALRIGEELALPIIFYDERLTTAAAGRVLLMADVSRAKRRGVVDKMAAVLILQSYMDGMAGGNRNG